MPENGERLLAISSPALKLAGKPFAKRIVDRGQLQTFSFLLRRINSTGVGGVALASPSAKGRLSKKARPPSTRRHITRGKMPSSRIVATSSRRRAISRQTTLNVRHRL